MLEGFVAAAMLLCLVIPKVGRSIRLDGGEESGWSRSVIEPRLEGKMLGGMIGLRRPAS